MALLPVPVYFEIENPAVVLTEVLVVFIEPSVLDDPAPAPALQFQETKVWLEAFNGDQSPKENPSLSKEVIPLLKPVLSAFPKLGNIAVDNPCTDVWITLLVVGGYFLSN